MIYIYTLKDPITNEIRYIGKTKQKFYSRLSAHKRYAKTSLKQTHFTNWVNKLLKLNLQPIMEKLEIVNEKNWQERERYWIKYYKSLGLKLTNTQEGGQGAYGGLNTASFLGKKHSKETKNIISIKNKNIKKSKEWIYNASQAQCKAIYGINLQTNLKIEFDCIRDAALYIGNIKYRKNIHQCLVNKRPSAYKYKWYYKIIDPVDKEQ